MSSQTKALDEEPMQIRSRTVAREFKSGHREFSDSLADVWTNANRRVSCIFPRQCEQASAVALAAEGSKEERCRTPDC